MGAPCTEERLRQCEHALHEIIDVVFRKVVIEQDERHANGTDGDPVQRRYHSDLFQIAFRSTRKSTAADVSWPRMSERYFQPWKGKNYETTRTLLMSESTYNWLDDDGQEATPQPDHPEGSIYWNIENFGKNRYFKQVNRALCRKSDPSAEEMLSAWNDLAYTIFVQESVGLGPGVRPTKAHWQSAGPHFCDLLEELRPEKVIVTGKDMWGMMPECLLRLLDDIQAYRLKDDSLVWCLALPHPANRTDGFSWQKAGESIRIFRACSFPRTWPSVSC